MVTFHMSVVQKPIHCEVTSGKVNSLPIGTLYTPDSFEYSYCQFLLQPPWKPGCKRVHYHNIGDCYHVLTVLISHRTPFMLMHTVLDKTKHSILNCDLHRITLIGLFRLARRALLHHSCCNVVLTQYAEISTVQ